MTEAGTNRIRSPKMGAAVALCVTLVLVALGVISVIRQATYSRADIGISVLSKAGDLLVEPRGAAAAAGLRSGDRLRSIDGRPFRSPFSWNRALLESPGAGPFAVTVDRAGEELTVQVPARVVRGTEPWYYYLALVGFFFLATATIAVLRPSRSPLVWRYYAFSVSVFALLALSDTPAHAPLDWVLFWGDRLGRLSFGPLFLLLAYALARVDDARLPRRLIVWVPPLLLGLAGLVIQQGAALGRLRDPLALWTLKDRLELLAGAAFIVFSLVVLAHAIRCERMAYRRYYLRWAFWGSAAGFAPLALLYLLPAGLGFDPPPRAELSTISLAILPLTLSTAIFRFRPGDLELYLKKALAYVSDAFLTLAVFEGALVFLNRIGGELLDLSPWMRTGVAALVAAFVYPGIRILTRQTIDRLVYGGRFSFRRTLLSFGRDLNAELNLEALVSKFQDRTRETLDLAAAHLLVRHDREGVLRTVVGPAELSVPIDSPLMDRTRDVSYIVLDDLLHAPGGERLQSLMGRGIQYLFPMKVEGEVRAVLATGPRRGGESLNSEDVELLVAVCGHAAIALESARLFAALKEKVEEIESLRRYNENIVESSRIGILVVDGDGVIRAMNRALVEIYGANRDKALGMALGEVFPLPLVRRLARPDERDDEPDGIRRLYRYPLNDLRGRRIVLNVSISELEAGEGERPGRVVTFDDVTDQVRMEEQLLRQDRLASIGLLAAGVAHEVNTPLTGISSYAQILIDELEPTDPRIEILRKIERQTFRASSIVHSLLNFTRDGTGAAETIRVRDLVDESLSLFEPQLRGRSVTIEARVEEGLPPVRGERGKLLQVLLNLLLNARDAIQDSGTIRVTARSRGGRLALEVADDGTGIPEEDIGKIFDPFFTTKPRGRGTGLGLSLSYNIIQQHQGEILVDSRRGEGSVFTVDLPFEDRGAVHA